MGKHSNSSIACPPCDQNERLDQESATNAPKRSDGKSVKIRDDP
jgi:hypothetical protein